MRMGDSVGGLGFLTAVVHGIGEMLPRTVKALQCRGRPVKEIPVSKDGCCNRI